MRQPQLQRNLISLLVIIALFITSGLFHPILAHGGAGKNKIQVDNEQVGPFNLLVATAPQPLLVGQMDVWVRVTDNETDRLLRDAVVTIRATHHQDSQTLTAQATHEHAGNAFDYIAHLDIEQSGQWNLTVHIEDEAGQAEVTFTETVNRDSNIFLWVALAVPLVVLAAALGVYLWRQSVAG